MNEGTISRKKAIYLALGLILGAFIAGSLLGSAGYVGVYTDSYSYEDCNVLALTIKGEVFTYVTEKMLEYNDDITSAEEIARGLVEAERDDGIKAVLLSVDSYGGDAVAGEEIASALKRFNKSSVALVRGLGLSTAYWASTGADKIYASKLSEVGSIAVTMSYLDESRRNDREGYLYTELSSGKFKNLGDPNKPLTLEERSILMSDLQKMHNVFVQDVARNRDLEISKVAKLSDGRSYLGADALAHGLIDEIGDLDTATKYLEEVLGEKVEYCWY
jgi:protease IV